jgi:hypothetical protein
MLLGLSVAPFLDGTLAQLLPYGGEGGGADLALYEVSNLDRELVQTLCCVASQRRTWRSRSIQLTELFITRSNPDIPFIVGNPVNRAENMLEIPLDSLDR